MDAERVESGFEAAYGVGLVLLLIGGGTTVFLAVGGMMVRCEPGPCPVDFWLYPEIALVGLALVLGVAVGQRL